jgi:hypothetical protein
MSTLLLVRTTVYVAPDPTSPDGHSWSSHMISISWVVGDTTLIDVAKGTIIVDVTVTTVGGGGITTVGALVL